jgi:hypothetical protein
VMLCWTFDRRSLKLHPYCKSLIWLDPPSYSHPAFWTVHVRSKNAWWVLRKNEWGAAHTARTGALPRRNPQDRL